MQKHMEMEVDPSLKGIQSKFGMISTMQNGCVVRVKQKSSEIYLIYQPVAGISEGKVIVSARLCELNKMESGQVSIEPVHKPSVSAALTTYVSGRDWKIINNRAVSLEEEFLNQIQLVWPNARLPLYYDPSNYVTLTIRCSQISMLGENTELEILQQQEPKQQLPKQQSSKRHAINLSKLHSCKFRNINTIEVPVDWQKSLFVLEIPPQFPDSSNHKNIKQHLQWIKKIPSKEQLGKIQVPLYPIFNPQIKQLTLNEALVYSFQLLSLNSQLIVRQSPIPQIKTFKLSFLLNSCTDFEIGVQILRTNQTYDEVINQLVEGLAYQLQNNGQIQIFDDFPFNFCERLTYVTFSRSKKSLGKRFILMGEKEITRELKNKLSQVIKITQIQQEDKAKHLISLSQALKTKKLEDPSFYEIYETAYAKQIKQIITHLEGQESVSILITSFGKNGKTTIYQILKKRNYYCKLINLSDLDDKSLTLGDKILLLESVFQVSSPQTILFFDNLDSLCFNIDEGDVQRKEQRITSKVITRKINLFLKLYRRKCIFTAKNQPSIDSEFDRGLIFQVHLKNPNLEMRKLALKQYGKIHQRELDVDKISQQSESMNFGEFSKFMITGKKPSSLGKKKKILEDFAKLAGMKSAKNKIKGMIQKPLKYNHLFSKLPVKLSRGVLLYGASGCGKTALGLALKDEFQMKYFNVKGSDILSKYIGGSEAAVRDIFEKAMSVSPSIIFFDEFETIVPRRNSSNTGVTDRVVNQFLCYLDGVASIQGVFIVAASSRPDLIDPALLRPGRIDNHIYLQYPNEEDRQNLLHLYGNSLYLKFEETVALAATQYFSYSDLVGLLKQLRIKKSVQVLQTQDQSVERFKEIDEDFFMKIISSYKISVSKQQQERQKKLFESFKNGTPIDMSKQKQMLH